MAPTVPRTHLKTSPGSPTQESFSTSRLVRLLAELTTDQVAASKQSLAERLGLWLDWADAISLSTALAAKPPWPSAAESAKTPTDSPEAAFPGEASAASELARVRAELAEAIASERIFAARGEALANPTLPSPDPAGPGEAAEQADHDFAACRRCYAAYQRAMDAAIAPLRAQVRATMQRASPELARLAALDAVLDQALAARERSLLSTVPGLLEKHFRRLRKTRPEALAGMGRDIQAVLLAELEIRLQPVEGLVEALGQPHEEATGRSRVSSSPLGGLARSDGSGGTHHETTGRSQVSSSPSGDLARSDRSGGALNSPT